MLVQTWWWIMILIPWVRNRICKKFTIETNPRSWLVGVTHRVCHCFQGSGSDRSKAKWWLRGAFRNQSSPRLIKGRRMKKESSLVVLIDDRYPEISRNIQKCHQRLDRVPEREQQNLLRMSPNNSIRPEVPTSGQLFAKHARSIAQGTCVGGWPPVTAQLLRIRQTWQSGLHRSPLSCLLRRSLGSCRLDWLHSNAHRLRLDKRDVGVPYRFRWVHDRRKNCVQTQVPDPIVVLHRAQRRHPIYHFPPDLTYILICSSF